MALVTFTDDNGTVHTFDIQKQGKDFVIKRKAQAKGATKSTDEPDTKVDNASLQQKDEEAPKDSNLKPTQETIVNTGPTPNPQIAIVCPDPKSGNKPEIRIGSVSIPLPNDDKGHKAQTDLVNALKGLGLPKTQKK
jgi:hypothetical protein